MIKNQRRWLREWLEFNLMKGFKQFIMYHNNSTDQSLKILQLHIHQGLITYVSWPPESVPSPAKKFKSGLERWQYPAFRDALGTRSENSWTTHK
jgi:hypothetical protein